MNMHFFQSQTPFFADLNEQKNFITFINQINQVLTKKKAKPIDTLEIEGLKRDWQFYLKEYPNTAHEHAAKDILMIREHEEFMFQKFCNDYDNYLDQLEKKVG